MAKEYCISEFAHNSIYTHNKVKDNYKNRKFNNILEASSLPSSISGSCLAQKNYFGSSLNLLPKLLILQHRR
ncbi:hypothetical protein LGK97_03615 [Clostridium sp. CS001]|uniref:hypothetical protein n=1 Tax=Clostridium sp. CS001 TaxID=2880648 RepID=UPI001CF50256|nr:hypothetical protein [Clostridium sp. CS001]MCB2288850.1 hypothetical protein [Clostridium sp. CS001]